MICSNYSLQFFWKSLKDVCKVAPVTVQEDYAGDAQSANREPVLSRNKQGPQPSWILPELRRNKAPLDPPGVAHRPVSVWPVGVACHGPLCPAMRGCHTGSLPESPSLQEVATATNFCFLCKSPTPQMQEPLKIACYSGQRGGERASTRPLPPNRPPRASCFSLGNLGESPNHREHPLQPRLGGQSLLGEDTWLSVTEVLTQRAFWKWGSH